MQHGRDDVVLLSDSLWRRRFHADPRIVGQSIQIDGALNRVVGVLPPQTPIPSWADLLGPISRLNKADLTSRKHHQLEVIGRLKPGATESRPRRNSPASPNAWSERIQPPTARSAFLFFLSPTRSPGRCALRC
jgi:hypothetical protein